MTVRAVETDYLVVGSGAMGMAFTDARLDAVADRGLRRMAELGGEPPADG